jgi:hypothetical protein
MDSQCQHVRTNIDTRRTTVMIESDLYVFHDSVNEFAVVMSFFPNNPAIRRAYRYRDLSTRNQSSRLKT